MTNDVLVEGCVHHESSPVEGADVTILAHPRVLGAAAGARDEQPRGSAFTAVTNKRGEFAFRARAHPGLATALQSGAFDVWARIGSLIGQSRQPAWRGDLIQIDQLRLAEGVWGRVRVTWSDGAAADANGNKITESYPSSLALDYTYNDIDVLTDISDGTNSIAGYTHIGARKKVTTFENGTTTSRTYTGFRNEVASIMHSTSTPTTISQFDYGYNKVHDRTHESYTGTGLGDAFAYDRLRRLTTAWMGSSGVTNPSTSSYVKKIAYNLDDDANRTSIVTTLNGGAPTTVSYSSDNLNLYTSVGGTARVHDTNGNVTDDGTHLFVYDYRNRVVQVKQKSGGAVIAEYRYDAMGRRVESTTGTTVRRLVRSSYSAPWHVEALSHVIDVFSGSNTHQRSYCWGDEVDEILMLSQADLLDFDSDSDTAEVTRSYYHRNALGSVSDISDGNQAVVASYRYAPFGVVTITRGGVAQSSDPLGQDFMFTARPLDAETGLYYFRARHHSPELGRFL